MRIPFQTNRITRLVMALAWISPIAAAIAAGTLATQVEAQRPMPATDSVAPPPAQNTPAVPDTNGVYRRGAGLTLPQLTDAAPLTYPSNAPEAEVPRICVLSLVVGADGVPAEVKVVRSLNDVVDTMAVESIGKRHFEPGTLDGKPVPVEIQINLHFFTVSGTALPKILRAGTMERANRKRQWDKPPVPIYQPVPEYSDKARRARLQGTVLLSFTVTQEGLPANIQVKRGLGMGLDEKAVQALERYKFKPAIKDGQPIAVEIDIEVMFRTF